MPGSRAERVVQRGFTLLEMLIALSIFSLISVGSYRLVNTTLLQSEASLQRMQEFRQLSNMLLSMEQELLQALQRPVRGNYGDLLPAFEGTFNGISFTHTGRHNPFGKAHSGLQRSDYVSVYLNDEKNNTRRYLVNYVWPVLDRAPSTDAIVKQRVPVVQIEWRFMDANGVWHATWPASNVEHDDNRLLPLGVQVLLISESFGEITRTFLLSPALAQGRYSD